MMMRNGGDGDGDGDEAGKVNVNGDESLKKFDLPKGYKFKPTDEEVIKYYLYPKINKLQLPPNSFKDVNIYAFTPWDLSDRYKSYGDNECYFFTPRERKYQKGKFPNRAANGGYWKSVKNNVPIIDKDTSKEIGHKRVLVFYQMKEKHRRTDWHMHEYILRKPKEKKEKGKKWKNKPSYMQWDELVVCKLYLQQRKSTDDMAVDVGVPPSIATPTTSAPAPVAENQYSLTSAAVEEEMVPENHQYKCQTDVAAAAADHQYRLIYMVVAAMPGEMMPENHHYMCQTNVAAADDHQYPLTSMVAAAVPEEMMSFDYDCYLDNVNPSSSLSAILSSVNHQCYDETNQHQFQSAILSSVNHQYYGEMNQQQLQLQSVTLPSANHHYNWNGEINRQQLQSAILPSANHNYNGNGEVNQQQLQEEILQEDGYGEMNQEQLQLQAEVLQQLQEAISPSANHHYNGEMDQQQLQLAELFSVNHHTYGQMNQQQQQQEEYEWNMLVTEMKNIGSHSNFHGSAVSPP